MTELELVDELRMFISDDIPSKNILNNQEQEFSDTKLKFFLRRALGDINDHPPLTSYTIEEAPDDLLLSGAALYAMIAEGILQARNQLDYNDAGFSISMFNKTGVYQGWAGFLLQTYTQGLNDFKRTVISSSPDAGFYGIRSPFSQDWGW